MLLNNLFRDLCYRLLYLFSTFVVGGIGYWVVYRLKDKFSIKGLYKKKQAEREEEFLKLEVQYSPDEEHEKIFDLSDEQLIEQLQQRKLKATFVLEAYIARALQITRELNCITEFIPQASEWAAKLDSSKEIKGPLHGLPVSVKDNCNVMGMDSTLGLGKRLYIPAEDHSVIVKVLLDLGAVPFCKTNVPQTLLSYDCCNPVFGTTNNYLNPELTPGGSSGGESTLIGAGGSIIGIGSDIGGSVRIPAHFSGIVGFKATKDIISPNGFQASLPNAVGVVGVPGLLARETKTLTKVFKHIVEKGIQQKYDPRAIPLGFDEKILNSDSKLRIGYFTSMPYYPLIGDAESVLLEAKRALELQGHTLVPFKLPDSYYIFELVMEFGLADGGSHFVNSWRSETVPSGLFNNYLACSAPRWARTIAATMIDVILPYFHSSRAALILRGGATKSGDLCNKLGERKRMIDAILSQWRSLNLDLVLCPTFPFPAIPHNTPAKQQAACIYTIMWNLFDFPCGVVPFGQESGEKIDSFDTDGDFVLRLAKKAVKNSTNMPISVQIVGLPYEEEKVLRGMQLLESLSPMPAKYWSAKRPMEKVSSRTLIEDEDE